MQQSTGYTRFDVQRYSSVVRRLKIGSEGTHTWIEHAHNNGLQRLCYRASAPNEFPWRYFGTLESHRKWLNARYWLD